MSTLIRLINIYSHQKPVLTGLGGVREKRKRLLHGLPGRWVLGATRDGSGTAQKALGHAWNDGLVTVNCTPVDRGYKLLFFIIFATMYKSIHNNYISLI